MPEITTLIILVIVVIGFASVCVDAVQQLRRGRAQLRVLQSVSEPRFVDFAGRFGLVRRARSFAASPETSDPLFDDPIRVFGCGCSFDSRLACWDCIGGDAHRPRCASPIDVSTCRRSHALGK